MHKQSSSAELV